MGLQRHDQFVHIVRLQDGFQILVLSEARAHFRLAAPADVSVHNKTQMGARLYVFHVLAREMAVAHNDHMLLVVAQFSKIAKKRPHTDALGGNRRGGKSKKHEERQAGKIRKAGDIQKRRERGDPHRVDREDHREFPYLRLKTVRAVQPEHIKRHHEGRRVQHGHTEIGRVPGELKRRLRTVHEIEADIGRQQIGGEDQHGVQDHVDRIQSSLISANHSYIPLNYI